MSTMSPTTPAGVLGLFVLIMTLAFAVRAVASLLPPVRKRERKMRRIVIGAPVLVVGIIAGLVALVWPGAAVPRPAAGVSREVAVTRQDATYVHRVRSIPVLAWHQVDHACSPAAAVCNAPGNDETVSKAQLTAELSYLRTNGYQSVTAGQYAAWAAGKRVALPPKPILLAFDDGTTNSYTDSTPVLQHFGFNAVTFIVSEFADGAVTGKHPFVGWDMTWAQLRALPSSVWSFAFHAGAHGHVVNFPWNKSCTFYYPCQLPAETDAAYQARVSGEITQGRRELSQELGSRVNTTMWAVPWNDVAQQPGLPVSGKDPARWLAKWASTQFKLIFIQDPVHNGYLHERYRLEVHGTWTEQVFETNLRNNVNDGFFDLSR
jgi:hypothetical protein